MDRIVRNSKRGVLLACVLLSCIPTRVPAQTIVRRSGVVGAYLYPFLPPVPYGRALSSAVANSFPNDGVGYSLFTNQTITAGAPMAAATAAQTPPTQSQASRVMVLRTANNELFVQWQGDTSSVRQISFGLFDSAGRMLARTDVTQLPAQALLTLTGTTTYYGVQVQYLNGMTSTSYAPIQ